MVRRSSKPNFDGGGTNNTQTDKSTKCGKVEGVSKESSFRTPVFTKCSAKIVWMKGLEECIRNLPLPFDGQLGLVAALDRVSHPGLDDAHQELDQLVDDLLLRDVLLTKGHDLTPERLVLLLHRVQLRVHVLLLVLQLAHLAQDLVDLFLTDRWNKRGLRRLLVRHLVKYFCVKKPLEVGPK